MPRLKNRVGHALNCTRVRKFSKKLVRFITGVSLGELVLLSTNSPPKLRQQRRTIIKNLSIILALIIGATVLLAGAFHYERDADMRHAFSVCNSSRVNDTPSESLCAEILDYYHLDFICQDANKSTENTCKVERI